MPSLLHSVPLFFLRPPSSSASPPCSSAHFFTPTPSAPLRTFLLPILPLSIPRNPLPIPSCTSPNHHQSILQSVAETNENALPCVRTFENDLARLTLVGSVSFHQALTAAAADGGQAADEHVQSGVPAMVVETLFPGPADDHSTVSTRLFLPAEKVKDKARRLRSSLTEDMLSGSTSRNILAMTFRQVVLQHLWNFELVLFGPGTERNMDDLENPREVPVSFLLSSSDERVISVLAEAVCLAALRGTERHFLDEYLGKTSGGFFRWFQRPDIIASKDSSVIIYKLFEEETVQNAKSLLESFHSNKHGIKGRNMKLRHNWWTPLFHSSLEKIGGPEFSAWISEYLPVYRLQIDADKLKNVKIEGWMKSTQNRWEVLLTHSQMVGLAEILDMFYEDLYSLPDKELLCSVAQKPTNLSNKKRTASLMNILSITFATGIFLLIISALGQLRFPPMHRSQSRIQEFGSATSSESGKPVDETVDAAKIEEFCSLLVVLLLSALVWLFQLLRFCQSGLVERGLKIHHPYEGLSLSC